MGISSFSAYLRLKVPALTARLAEFQAGYETVAPWPDPDRQVYACIVARSLLIANDVITQPEWLRHAPEIYERGERRIQDMLDRVGA